jgi:4-diphosphocytidyl-2-C-methyl-D-erythritol kinase
MTATAEPRKPPAASAITVAAPAKINLHLEVLGRRADGFHELETVFQTLDLHDEVTVALTPGPDAVTLWCSDPALPADHANLAWRAAAAVLAARPGLGRVAITLAKRLPAGAGLGGGSSDAAAVLRALAALDARVAALDLPALALGLGSDVPFFLVGGTAHATGRGEVLTPLPDIPAPAGLTVLMPEGAHLATPAVFRELTDEERGPRDGRGAAWFAGRLAGGAPAIAANRLTAPARRLCPPLADLLDHLHAHRVPHVMTGSGAACVAFATVVPPLGVTAWPTAFRHRADLTGALPSQAAPEVHVRR